VAAAALPAMMKATDGEAKKRRRRWLTVTAVPAAAGSRTNREEEKYGWVQITLKVFSNLLRVV